MSLLRDVIDIGKTITYTKSTRSIVCVLSEYYDSDTQICLKAMNCLVV